MCGLCDVYEARRYYRIVCDVGDSIGSGTRRSLYDYFMAMFPQEQLTRVAAPIKEKLVEKRLQGMTCGKILKLVEILIVGTR